MNTIAPTACRLLAREETFILATIMSHKGSTPRTAGSKMIITAAGRGIGTIGGGLLEAGVMARAEGLIPRGQSAVMRFDLSVETIASMDMICGGQAEVLLDCITPTDTNRAVFEAWRQVLEQNEKGCFITVVMVEGDAVDRVSHRLVRPGDDIESDFPLTGAEREKIAAAIETPGMKTLAFGSAFVVLEPAERRCAAHLFGAGHVARPTAHLAALVGFRVHVYDDRPEYANRDRFPEAHAVRVLETFDRSFDGLSPNADDFVVILTRGHLHDQNVLARALATTAGYIGMIGSRKKRQAIYRNLRDQGATQQDIDRVHSPIGLAIGAETPEEIAVSIVSELIAVRAGVQP
jgi:xanthine dehydrogenase accessory factor